MTNLVLLYIARALEDSSTVPSSPFDRDSFTAKLFPNGIYDFVIQVAAFIILILLMFFFAYKPIRAYMKKRHDYIDNELREAEAKKKEAINASNRKEELIQEGKDEAKRIVSLAKADAENYKAKAIEDANNEIARKRKEADEDIALAKEKSIVEANKEIVNLTLQASSKLLERSVNEDDDKKFVDDFVKKMKGENK
ncbi:MAG: F0F1 ATP synthase subunit B [Bacillales bacterium]|nr:F0F1 ATP synthase subunit B [Mollicutes bacterium]MCI7213206.1 F0F1 ATP synthase subunit B [Bacillales bacterium]MDY3904027.1 F0F1 ATP synthase subunit B [Candidatus Enteromonas sp.]